MRCVEAPSPNFNERKLPISMIVLHYTGMRSAEEAIARLRDPAAEVSSHYVVDEDGTLLRLVDDDKRAFNKRIQDLMIGSVAAVLLAPVMVLTALAIRLDSPGPIFFRQRRHGFNHEEVVVWKFRTMKVEASDATASRQVTADDDRVTRVGRILRSTSLDELPQLLNVLKGEMSLVGPRPPLPRAIRTSRCA